MSEDLIRKQDAYAVLTEYYHHRTEIQHKALREALGRVPDEQETCKYWDSESNFCALCRPSAYPSAEPDPCDLCKSYGLEDGDTLYISADWDGGVGFDYIRDIHYCPKCGRRLIHE